jgi:hypothetical protein
MDFQMPDFEPHPPRYHHFVLLLWEERDLDGLHVAWRFSLQDPHEKVRIGFKNIEGLTAYLEGWMKDSSENNTQNFNKGD